MKTATFPFISLRNSLLILRAGIPMLFMAHAIVRIANGSMPQFAGFLGSIGFPQPLLVVWAITLTELIAGSLLVLGFWQRYVALALACIAAGGIVLIHANIGWFVGEHGTGVDVQHHRPASDLFQCIAQHSLEIANLKLGRQFLAARRIDTLANHAEGFIETDSHGFRFGFNDSTGHS